LYGWKPRLGHGVVSSNNEENATMPEIRENSGVVTQITTIKVPPEHQSEVMELMEQRARFMATQPGFVSISLHKSDDGGHLVNYVQWTNRKKLEAAHHSPEFRKQWPRFGELINEAEPCLYRVVHVEAARGIVA
jgi:heme-degrading monooxygenase HmoA